MKTSGYKKFVQDYNNLNLTVNEVKKINGLTKGEYRDLKEIAIENGDIPLIRNMKNRNAKYYSQDIDGKWVVQKYKGKKKLFVGKFKTEDDAKKVVEKCKEVDWKVDEIQDFIDSFKPKHKYYTLINGYYVIQKSVNGHNRVFAAIPHKKIDEDVVRNIVEDFKKCNWDYEMKNQILNKYGYGELE